MAGKSPVSETRTLTTAEQLVARVLPGGWSAKVVRAPGRSSGQRDTSLRIRPPDDEPVDFDLKVNRSLGPREAARLLDSLGIEENRAVRPRPRGLVVVAPYLSDRTRELLADRGVSYVDTTGNIRIQADRPALFITLTGADRDPWPGDQPLKSLRGRGAGRAVRAVVDFRPPYGVRELASRADVSPATLARVIDLLDREALLTRDRRGGVTDVDWARCIRRWSQDYSFTGSNTVTSFLAPRGITDVTTKLADVRWRYAVTGSLAAQQWAPYAPARLAQLYVDDVGTAARALDLRETDSGANVRVAEPFDPVAYERPIRSDGLVSAAPSQVAADLLTGPGCMPSEGDELLEWMRSNEDAWRT